MLNQYHLEHRRLQEVLGRVNALEFLGRSEQAVVASLYALLPPDSISTHEAALMRELPGRDGMVLSYKPDLTPYSRAIDDACDEVAVQVVAVSGNGRSGKTASAENHAFKRLKYGPFGPMLWYMQSQEDVDDYLEERGEFMVTHHPEIDAKIEDDSRKGRSRKRIGGYIQRWLPATPRTLVGKSAPFIVADEIDVMNKKLRASILTRLLNRQREFGTAALLYVASHPDAGEDDGITNIINQGLRHLWWWQCPHCDKPSSPHPKATVRMGWNVPELLGQTEGMDKDQVLDFVAENAVLICPHCREPITNEQRLEMSLRTGKWLQPHQEMMDDGEVDGEHLVNRIMGFVIHAFMSPFVRIGDLAREFVAAKLTSDLTGDDTDLREVTAKSLGEVYAGSLAEEMIEDWQVVKARLGAGAEVYARGTVPPGVRFLTAFADVQGYGWEVRVVGWGANYEFWLIDAYALRQWQPIPGLDVRELANLNPATRLADWRMLEHFVIERMFPLAERPGFFLPIGKLMVDDNGVPGVSNIARVWLSNLCHRGKTVTGKPFAKYRVQLVVGAARGGKEVYGIPKPIDKDDEGRQLPTRITLLAHDVTTIKRIIARRMKIDTPGPGMMHLPADLPDSYVKELVAERFINGEWIRSGRNETWDGWVACDSARAWLRPERVIWDPADPNYDPPEWATPLELAPSGEVNPAASRRPRSQWERIAAMNAGLDEDDGNGGTVL